MFYEIIPFDTHSTANLPPLSILKKKSSFFSKKPQILNILKIRTILVAFNGKFATIWSKNNFTFSSVNKLADVAWTQLANIGFKKTSEIAHLIGIFCFRILNIAKNEKKKTKSFDRKIEMNSTDEKHNLDIIGHLKSDFFCKRNLVAIDFEKNLNLYSIGVLFFYNQLNISKFVLKFISKFIGFWKRNCYLSQPGSQFGAWRCKQSKSF